MKVYIHTFGCKVNRYESDAIASQLQEAKHTLAAGMAEADVVIVNSCTVTENSDRKVSQYLRHVRRQNPNAVLVLSGCLPQAYPERARSQADADIITGNRNRSSLLVLIEEYLADKCRRFDVLPSLSSTFEPLNAVETTEHTRAFLKIEDGCDRFCAYCVIPFARGPVVRSMPLETVRRHAEQLAQKGYREIVLTGINLSLYGREYAANLADAAEAVCSVGGIQRVRLGSLEPDLLAEQTLRRLAAQPKLCPHFHLSLQSGCDDTLRRMKRRYTTSAFTETSHLIRSLFASPSFTTDLIVGFPGETEEDFEQSLAYVRQFRFLKCHLFPYSARPGTAAAELPCQIPRQEKLRRMLIMKEAAETSRLQTLESFVGRPVRILLEQHQKSGWTGYTDQYLPAVTSQTGLVRGSFFAGTVARIEQGMCVLE